MWTRPFSQLEEIIQIQNILLNLQSSWNSAQTGGATSSTVECVMTDYSVVMIMDFRLHTMLGKVWFFNASNRFVSWSDYKSIVQIRQLSQECCITNGSSTSSVPRPRVTFEHTFASETCRSQRRKNGFPPSVMMHGWIDETPNDRKLTHESHRHQTVSKVIEGNHKNATLI